MEITIHLSDVHVHIHMDNPGNLQPIIDKLKEADELGVAKTAELQNAVEAAKGATT